MPYHLVEAAAGKQNGSNWSLITEDSNLGGTKLVEATENDKNTVKLIELSEIRSLYGDYEFLKIDAEGHEVHVIESDKEYIIEKCQAVFFEENSDSDHFNIIDLFLKNNFNLYLCIFPAYNKNNYKSSKKRLFNIACEANVLATRKTMSMDDELIKLGCHLLPFKTLEEFAKIRHYVPRWGEESWDGLSNVVLKALLSEAIIAYNNTL